MAVLIVDDNLLNRELLYIICAGAGYVPECAIDGSEAVKMTLEKRYDLVLMDLDMPVMNGVEATTQIRKVPKYNDVPIIAVTSNDVTHDEAYKRILLDAGFDALVTKPIATVKMVAWLNHHKTTEGGHSRSIMYECGFCNSDDSYIKPFKIVGPKSV